MRVRAREYSLAFSDSSVRNANPESKINDESANVSAITAPRDCARQTSVVAIRSESQLLPAVGKLQEEAFQQQVAGRCTVRGLFDVVGKPHAVPDASPDVQIVTGAYFASA